MTNPFSRVDETDDRLFYQVPRLVQHIDDSFIQNLQALFREVLPPQAEILDLMSSWVSHLPKDLVTGPVVGLGMNQVELAANPQLKEYVVQNLNQNPQLPFADRRFDAVLITVSIQYVTQPLALMKEVHRVLKPAGKAVVSFSNRMFPTKAVALWRETSDEQHIALVSSYFQEVPGFEPVRVVRKLPRWFLPQDPFYAVIAQRFAEPLER